MYNHGIKTKERMVENVTDRKYSLKELRARKGETQAETAHNLGVSTTTYNAWEKDISNVSVSKVLAVAEYFGVTIGDIFLPNNMK